MKFEEIREYIAEMNEEALLADGFEDALIGYVCRFGLNPIALYDRDKCIDILKKRDGMTYEEAVEFFEFNTAGAWVGDGTPAFATILRNPGEVWTGGKVKKSCGARKQKKKGRSSGKGSPGKSRRGKASNSRKR
jgi:hypothetical protein